MPPWSSRCCSMTCQEADLAPYRRRCCRGCARLEQTECKAAKASCCFYMMSVYPGVTQAFTLLYTLIEDMLLQLIVRNDFKVSALPVLRQPVISSGGLWRALLSARSRTFLSLSAHIWSVQISNKCHHYLGVKPLFNSGLCGVRKISFHSEKLSGLFFFSQLKAKGSPIKPIWSLGECQNNFQAPEHLKV